MIVTLAEKDYVVVKKGREQAEQVIQLGRWISMYGIPAASKLVNDKGEIAFSDGLDLVNKIIDVLTPDALIALFSVIIGCNKKVAEAEFDVGVLLDSLIYVYENQPSFKRVISRFFSEGSSEPTTGNDSSTTSEPITDGQTT